MRWLRRLKSRYRAHLVGKVESDRLPLVEMEWRMLPWALPLGLAILAAWLGAELPTWLILATGAVAAGGAIYVGKVMISAWLERNIADGLEEERRKTQEGERKV